MGRGGGGRSGGGGFSSGGGRGFSSHRSSGSSGRNRGGMGMPSSSRPPRSPRPPRPPMWSMPSMGPRRPLCPSYRRTTVILPGGGRSGDLGGRPGDPGNRPIDAGSRPGDLGENIQPTYGEVRPSSGKEGWLPGWYKWISVLMLILAAFLLFSSFNLRRGMDTAIVREKLPAEACILSDQWIDDRVDWIADTATVKQGMEYFYDKTGVQPYLLICDSLDGMRGEITDGEAESALKELYHSLYEDEGHMIFAFMEYESSEYITWIYAGRSAASVVDEDARELILNYADRYYTDSSLTDEEFFAKIFETSADAMMKDPGSAAGTADMYAVISVAILVMMAGGLILFKLREQRMKEREQIKEVLSMPIGPSPEEAELEEKYKED